MNPGLQLLLAFLLVLLTGFFVAAELALVKIRATRVDELAARKVFGAAKAQLALKDLGRYLFACKFGVMVSTIILGSIGEPALSSLLPLSHTVGTIVALVIVSIVEFIIGEIAPTALAIHDAEKILLATIYPLDVFTKLVRWPLAAMQAIASVVLRPFGLSASGEHGIEDAHSAAEIRMLVQQSGAGGALNASEVRLVNQVFDFTHRQAKEVLVPRPDVICLSTDKTLAENVAIAEASGYTRLPLCIDGSADEIVGMIHVRDLLRFQGEDLRQIARDLPRIPETKPIDQLLRELQRSHQHMAIVVDEFGGTAGIVTTEDIIEEIVGDIQDEHDPTRPEMEPDDQGSYLVDARMSLEKLTRTLAFHGPEEETDIETVGGWLLVHTGGKLRVGDTAAFGEATLTIVEMTGRRVRKARVTLPERNDDDALSSHDA